MQVGVPLFSPMFGEKAYAPSALWAYSSGGAHRALDAAKPLGSPIYTPWAGVVHHVVKNVPNPSYASSGSKPSNFVVIWTFFNGKKATLFVNHMSPGSPVSYGQKLAPGQLLGVTGITGNTTGPHDHIVGMWGWVYWEERYSYLNNASLAIWPLDGFIRAGLRRSQILRGAAAAPSAKATEYPGSPIKPGDTSPQVAELKRRLRANNQSPGYGPGFRNMVINLQKAHPELGAPDGIIGPKTFNWIMNNTKPVLPVAPYPGTPIKPGTRSAAVVEVKNRLGWTIDSAPLYNKMFIKAVVDFQKAHAGLGKADGIIGPKAYNYIIRWMPRKK